jgi:hypothetical protein
MTKGSCACGDWTYEFTGEPIFAVSNISNPHAHLLSIDTENQGMCHCNWCRKTSGHNGNTFIVIMDNAVSQEKNYPSTAGRANIPPPSPVQAIVRHRLNFRPHRRLRQPHEVVRLREVQHYHVGAGRSQAAHQDDSHRYY